MLPDTRAGNHIAGQIFTFRHFAISNHGEAEAAESRDDFIHKLKICLKELRETRRWARLIKQKAWVKNETILLFVLGESEELIRIFIQASRQPNGIPKPKRANRPIPAVTPPPQLAETSMLGVEC